MPSLAEIDPMVLKKKIFKLGNVFSLFFLYLPLEKVISLIFTNLDLRHVPSLIEIGPMVMLKKIFQFSTLCFR